MKSTVQLILFISFFLHSSVTFANDCSTAEMITSIPYSYTGTTVGAGNNYTNAQGCNNSYISGNDFVFEYTTTGNEVLGIELVNLNDDDHGLFVFDGCPDNPATACIVGDQVNTTDSVFIETVHLQTAGTYYIIVSSWSGATVSYDFELSITNPVGNICENAFIINSVPFTHTGTTVGSGNDYFSGLGCNTSYISGRDYVFEYTSTGDEVLGIELANLNDDDHSLYVFDGCPDDPATMCIVGDLVNNSDSVFLETVHLQTAGTYYFVVSSWAGATRVYDFDLSITVPIGNICENAFVINNVPFMHTGTTVGSGNDYVSGLGCNTTYISGRDYVFEYTSAGNEVLGIELENLNDDDHSLYVFDGCPDDPATLCVVGNQVSNLDSVFLETVHLQSAGTYYFVVSSWAGATVNYDFELSITVPVGNICENAVVVNAIPYNYSGTTVGSGNDYTSALGCNNTYISGRDFVFEYTSPGDEVLGIELENLYDDDHSMYVFDGCPSDPTTMCVVGDQTSGIDSVFLETVYLQSPGTYYFVVSSWDGATRVYDFNLSITAPTGNICENARQVTALPYSYTGTTLASGDDYSSGDGCSSVYLNSRDYVFEYTPLGNEFISITLSNVNDDRHGLFIVEGCPDDIASVCYDFQVEAGSNPITLSTSMCLTAGTTYYIIASSWDGGTIWYDFTLDIVQDLQASISATESSGLTNDNYLCDNEAGTAIVNLSANATGGNGGGYSFLWDNATASTTAGISEMPVTTTTFTVTATDTGGCSVVESYTIEVDPPLIADIMTTENSGIGNDDIICASMSGTSLYTLDAFGSSGGFGTLSYEWNTSDISPVISEMPITTTSYTVTITDDHNCSESASQQVIINPALSVVLTGTENSGAMDDLIICGSDAGSESAILTAAPSGGTSGYTYDWSPQNGVNPTLNTTPNVSTTYTVTVTDSNGCDAIENITVEVVNASCIWIGPTNMNWYDNPNFWSLGRFPTVCDHVVIPSGKFVTLRNGFHGWGNTLEVDGELDTRPGSELDIVTEY